MPELFLALIFGHFLADYPLQGSYLAQTKLTSPYSLLAHAVIQGGVAGFIAGTLGYPALAIGIVVGLTHFWIDWGKISGAFGFIEDQFLHILTIGLLTLWAATSGDWFAGALTFAGLWAFVHIMEIKLKWGYDEQV